MALELISNCDPERTFLYAYFGFAFAESRSPTKLGLPQSTTFHDREMRKNYIKREIYATPAMDFMNGTSVAEPRCRVIRGS